MIISAPIPDSYWLLEGRLLAGEYPGANSHERARVKLDLFLSAGIRSFVDLTEPSDPLVPYTETLAELARERGIEYRYTRLGVRDLGVPSRQLMAEILDAITAELVDERPLYFHCWGGIGRTGTVAGCWLVEQGLSAEDALNRINVLRFGSPDGWKRSPETDEQREFVRSWSRDR